MDALDVNALLPWLLSDASLDFQAERLNSCDPTTLLVPQELKVENGQFVRGFPSLARPLRNFSWIVPGIISGSALVGCPSFHTGSSSSSGKSSTATAATNSSSSSSSSNHGNSTGINLSSAELMSAARQQQIVQLQYLKRQGVSAIVNLCREYEALVDEDLLQALGFKYLHVAVTDMHPPTHQQLDHVLEWIEQHQGECEEQGQQQGVGEGRDNEKVGQEEGGRGQQGQSNREGERPAAAAATETEATEAEAGGRQGYGQQPQKQKQQGKGVVVHCYAGQGRTGTVLAAWLMLQALKGKGGAGLGTQPQQQQEEQQQRLREAVGAIEIAHDTAAESSSAAAEPASGGAGHVPLNLPLTAAQAIARVRLLRPSSVESYVQEKALGEYQEHLLQRWTQLLQGGGGAAAAAAAARGGGQQGSGGGDLKGGLSLGEAHRVAEALEKLEAREDSEGVVHVLQSEVKAGHVLPV